MGKKYQWAILGVGCVAVACAIIYIVKVDRQRQPSAPPSTTVHVAAAENFWGSIVAQIGGSHVSVTSIVSDPNTDPHEYETNTNDARAFANAGYVILNGAGYDSWGDKLVSADGNSQQKVLRVSDLLGKKDGDNPHFWYSPTYVNEVAAQMEKDLASVDPADAAYYQQQYVALQASFAPYQSRIATIKQQFGGTPVASTESIFVYLADAAGLNLVSPPAFIDAVAEGNDPPAQSVATFEQQLASGAGAPRVLVYNEQTVTPVTDSMKALAAQNDIPVVGVTETIQPPDVSFQDWMNAQLIELQNALNAQKPLDSKNSMADDATITAKNLAAAYGEHVVWRDANFSVKAGTFVGILGPNGGGKTTLLRLLLGLSRPAAGELHMFGEPPRRGNPRIGYVPQRHLIDSDTAIEALELVRIGISGSRWGFSLSASAERKMAMDALATVSATELAHRPLGKLSGGELQRIFLAEALVAKPDLLLLDEPLANLDIRRETSLVQLAADVVKSHGVTVLLIAHNVNPLLPVLDSVIYIAEGRVETGTPAEVFTTERLSKIYAAPVEVLRDSRGRLAVLGVDEGPHHHG